MRKEMPSLHPLQKLNKIQRQIWKHLHLFSFKTESPLNIYRGCPKGRSKAVQHTREPHGTLLISREF